ncbi:hypothetical protein SEEGA711_14525, partial [Salmonella enterica subsp. enterica serovar Gaminara str. ATCC BAA-711]
GIIMAFQPIAETTKYVQELLLQFMREGLLAKRHWTNGYVVFRMTNTPAH